tara:strand:+ start:107 stop:490 length:384 start_codon:yes stop_codon:yes gene_type:complete
MEVNQETLQLMDPLAQMPEPFILAESAAIKVKELLKDEEAKHMMLRVFVQGGGCSGFQYGFSFAEEIEEDDTKIEKFGVTMLVDSMSYSYLVGSEIYYKDDLNGSQFVIKNPNAKATCGCGSSFAAG